MNAPCCGSSIPSRVSALALVIALATCLTACGGDDANDGGGGGSGPVPISSGARMAWNQAAASLQELQSLSYRLYVDGSQATMADVSCGQASTPNGYECSGRLPGMSPGRHTLELTSVLNGVESAHSAPLTVMLSASAQFGVSAAVPVDAVGPAVGASVACVVRSSGDKCYDVRLVASGLNDVTMLTSTLDGRVLFADGGASVHVIAHDAPSPALTLPDPESRIVGLAVDRRIPSTHAVFVAWTESARGGSLLNVTRYRELQGALGEGATIVSGVPIPAGARAPLAVDGDGLLYVALPAGEETAPDRRDQAPFGGVVLRVDRDGLTPPANPRTSPIISNGYAQPSTLAFDVVNGRVWLGGQFDAGSLVTSLSVLPRGTDRWTLRSAAVATPSFKSRDQTSGPVLAFVPMGPASLAMLVTDAALFLATPTPEGQLALEELVLNQGVPLSVAHAYDNVWYVAVRTDQGGVAILAVQPRP
ncbi:MAG TPA: PQQ-dependent sugar dehydrogenase [Vicinamibacterales bacterium]|nr:PQQ-dependent sugar dehydrogenase [Vicinamibacterales bacterium]